ncbi:SDR family NAD(P)-dependent oxidoreductase [Vallitalea guaymasensis]|uniref:SDR family NAD(P)-dependent oxidoreductase n=1 Tax=Vallitalea guaymasensis TaxID=1185412 RepID=UPI00272C3C76|nr:SDR family NAD(P)-dependent oxidoreductase [Vallitalea guaymasensis]
MLEMNLTKKVAIVTGGAGGLGKAIALKLAEAGAEVTVSDINLEGAKETVDEIKAMGQASIAVKTDITKSAEVSSLVETTIKEFGNLHIMINAAGMGIIKPVSDFADNEIDKILDLNLKGTIYGTREALKHMIPNKEGKIINISSIAAKNASPGTSMYAATKSGVIAFSKAVAREVAHDNININVICPGIIKTPMWIAQLKTMADSVEEQNKIFDSYIESEIPLNRPQEPEDIANIIVYLCSEQGKNITAQDINVDGGSIVF